ncbi:MAG: DUF3078 domain-containing protein [Bacteroidales bacterium]|nr:DUF3078 domain-containing protein [Bacteroidales bacterium]
MNSQNTVRYQFFIISFWLVLSLFFTSIQAQNIPSNDSIEKLKEANLIDLIDDPHARLIIKTESSRIENEETNNNHHFHVYNRLMMPLQFSKSFPEDIWKIKTISIFNSDELHFDSLNVIKNSELEDYFALDSVRQKIYHRIIFRHPNWVESIQKELPSDFLLTKVESKGETKEALENLFSQDFGVSKELFSAKLLHNNFRNRGHWITANKASMQFSQNYISTNWQQGGESNLAMNGLLNMKANYINPNGWALNNELEWRSSFFTAPSDTVRPWRVSDDLFRLSSNLAIKAFNKWNYSISSEFKTRFFNSYKTNSNTKLGSFLSPAEFNFGIGMSYEDVFDRLSIKGFSLQLSPFSYNWKYVLDDERIDVTRFGLVKGQNTLNQIGSRWDMKLSYNVTKNIAWTTRFYYFTTYKNVESEWENTFNFIINRYFSTRLFYHLKYDDKRKRLNDDDSYFQFKELLSFGLNYSWR